MSVFTESSKIVSVPELSPNCNRADDPTEYSCQSSRVSFANSTARPSTRGLEYQTVHRRWIIRVVVNKSASTAAVKILFVEPDRTSPRTARQIVFKRRRRIAVLNMPRTPRPKIVPCKTTASRTHAAPQAARNPSRPTCIGGLKRRCPWHGRWRGSSLRSHLVPHPFRAEATARPVGGNQRVHPPAASPNF